MSVKRKRSTEAAYAAMQREIDLARTEIFNRAFAHVAAVNPNGGAMHFCRRFEEAWRRSLLPDSKVQS